MQVYTFDFICECQDFNHNEEFVLKEDLDSEMESKQKEIQSLKKMIVEARPFFQYLVDTKKDSLMQASDWLERAEKIKVDA